MRSTGPGDFAESFGSLVGADFPLSVALSVGSLLTLEDFLPLGFEVDAAGFAGSGPEDNSSLCGLALYSACMSGGPKDKPPRPRQLHLIHG